MQLIAISEFKSKCIAVLKEARRSGKCLIVTWRGQPIARIEPIAPESGKRKLGTFRGHMKIHGDIVHVDTSADWEALR